MAKKFYCVKVGRAPGMYLTWDECKAQVDGFSGAVYKGFSTEAEATAYLSGNENNVIGECEATAYTDGSFDIKTGRFAMGAVMFIGDKTLEFSEAYEDEELAQMRNVAGEIFAATAVMRYCVEHDIKSLEILYDYEGVEKWCTGEWKTNRTGTAMYKEYYLSIKDKLKVKFTKVKGHSGDKYNDMADALAKAALGL